MPDNGDVSSSAEDNPQEQSHRSHLQCTGITRNGVRCQHQVTVHQDTPSPIVCAIHRGQKLTTCVGKNADGTGCENRIRRIPPFDQFCPTHKDDAMNMKSPIHELPDDVGWMILDLLSSPARVALALCNRVCLNFVRRWGFSRTSSNLIRPAWSISRQPLHIHGAAPTSSGYVKLEMVSWPGYWRPPMLREFKLPCTFLKRFDDNDEFTIYTRVNITSMLDCPCLSQRGESRLHRLWEGPTGQDSHFNSLSGIIRAYPWLFSQTLGLCMSCRCQLTTADSQRWARLSCLNRSLRTRGLEKGQKGEELAVPLCTRCQEFARIFFPWCDHCHSPISPTIIARAYWKTQVPRPDENVDNLEIPICVVNECDDGSVSEWLTSDANLDENDEA